MCDVVYLGPEGTWTHLAAQQYQQTEARDMTLKAASPLFKVFSLFKDKACDEIVIPFENSVEGAVTQSVDFLTKDTQAFIKAELVIPIRHCLLAKQAVDLQQLSHVYSHPQALAQCSHFLWDELQNKSKCAIESAQSTAFAAKALSENKLAGECPAVIGSSALAERYNLVVLKENINDFKNNQTRFVVISRQSSPPSGEDKTSVAFTAIKEQPGSLYDVLGEFKRCNINLTHISSRPDKDTPGHYVFFIDFDGHKDDETVKQLLQKLKGTTQSLKVLGSYKKDKNYD